jgi:hypothetical protein
MQKSDVFISYSHRDEKYKDELLRHLRILEKQGVASFWDTSLIPAGADWSREIRKAIDKTRVAVLLISPDFLASDYVVDQELPALFKSAKERNVIVLPILVRPTLWTSVPDLAQFQFLNDVARPLSTSENRDEDFARIAGNISELLLAIKSKEFSEIKHTATQDKSKKLIMKPECDRHVFLSHSKLDGDFAELMKLRLEREGFIAWIDNDRLDPGIDWRQEIDDSIKKALAVIAVMSPDARDSEYVTYEWAFAWGAGVPVVPLMLRDTSLHPRLAALQYLDFTNRRARPWERLLKTLDKLKNGS